MINLNRNNASQASTIKIKKISKGARRAAQKIDADLFNRVKIMFAYQENGKPTFNGSNVEALTAPDLEERNNVLMKELTMLTLDNPYAVQQDLLTLLPYYLQDPNNFMEKAFNGQIETLSELSLSRENTMGADFWNDLFTNPKKKNDLKNILNSTDVLIRDIACLDAEQGHSILEPIRKQMHTRSHKGTAIALGTTTLGLICLTNFSGINQSIVNLKDGALGNFPPTVEMIESDSSEKIIGLTQSFVGSQDPTINEMVNTGNELLRDVSNLEIVEKGETIRQRENGAVSIGVGIGKNASPEVLYYAEMVLLANNDLNSSDAGKIIALFIPKDKNHSQVVNSNQPIILIGNEVLGSPYEKSINAIVELDKYLGD